MFKFFKSQPQQRTQQEVLDYLDEIQNVLDAVRQSHFFEATTVETHRQPPEIRLATVRNMFFGEMERLHQCTSRLRDTPTTWIVDSQEYMLLIPELQKKLDAEINELIDKLSQRWYNYYHSVLSEEAANEAG